MATDLLYLPWANEALVRGESLYALLNKFAWFSDRGRLQLIRDLKATEVRPSPTTPKSIEFFPTAGVWRDITTFPQIPLIHGLPLGEYISQGRFDTSHGYFGRRVYQVLRYCPECVSVGMHFDVTQ